MWVSGASVYFIIYKYHRPILTRMPSQRDTARSGRNALSVRIERNAGISAAPTNIAVKFINDNYQFTP